MSRNGYKSAGDERVPFDRSGARNVPATLNSFVGRNDERADVARLVDENRLVTLAGPAGVGKTRLAIEMANEFAASYPGGAWVVELAPISNPVLLPQTLASVLGVQESPNVDLVDAIIDRLEDRRVLLVLDNCEHLIEDCASLVERLLRSCPQLVILATSREPLLLNGESVRRIGPLEVPPANWQSQGSLAAYESVQLFLERGASARAGFSLTDDVAPGIAELCRRLDGMPLAIELAAARLEVLTPHEIVENLGNRFQVLGSRTTNAPSHHATLEAALDWGYKLLSEPEAALLRRLSVFVGGCRLAAMQAICSLGAVAPERVIDTLGALVNKSWVIADTRGETTRYRLLETVRDYVGAKLFEAGECDAMRTAHCAWFIELAEQAEEILAFETDAAWLRQLDDEQDNFRAGLEWALTEGQCESALRLGGALVLFWWLRGRVREGRQWLERAMATSANEPADLRAKVLWGAGLLASAAGEVGLAVRLAEESIELSNDADGTTAVGRARNLLGLLALYQGALRALPLLEKNVELARAEGDSLVLGSSLANLGRAHLLLGDARSARQCFEACLELTEFDNNRSRYEGVLSGLGQAALLEGDYATATELLQQAADLGRKLGEAEAVAAVLSWLGEVARCRGDYEQARALLGEGLVTAQQYGAPFSVARCLCFLGLVAEAEGKLAEARSHLSESLSMARPVGLSYLVARALAGLGQVSLDEGDLTGAQAWLDEALSVARENGDRHTVASVRYTLANLARVRGPVELAHSLCFQALTLQHEIGDLAGIAGSLELLAVIRGPDAAAVRLVAAAKALRESGGYAARPAITHQCDADMASARDALGDVEFADAWAAGTSLSVDEAVAYALRKRGTHRRTAAGPASLTPAQLDVARLAAKGMTNREIGERLFVSPRTAGAHLSHVFAKLGISSRRELANLSGDQAEEPSLQSDP